MLNVAIDFPCAYETCIEIVCAYQSMCAVLDLYDFNDGTMYNIHNIYVSNYIFIPQARELTFFCCCTLRVYYYIRRTYINRERYHYKLRYITISSSFIINITMSSDVVVGRSVRIIILYIYV